MDNKNMIAPRKSTGKLKRSTYGDWIIVAVMILLIITCILPILSVVAVGLSDPRAVNRREVTFLPLRMELVDSNTGALLDPETDAGVAGAVWRPRLGFQAEAFGNVLTDNRFMRSLAWTAILTFIVVVMNLAMTILCAYPLTYESLKGRKILTVFVIFTMYFGAGLIPTFILFRDLRLLNNPLVLILPGMISVFFMVIMRNFFMGIPESLKESAEIDGAGPMYTLVKIILPLSKPVLATVGLFYAVGRWNGFMDGLFFLPGAQDWHPIQLLLYNIMQGITSVDVNDPGDVTVPGMGPAMESAAIVIATIPILCVYPFAQKYFVKGATLGAVKG